MGAVDERLVGEDDDVSAQRRRDALDGRLFDRAQHAPSRAFAIGRPHDELGDEVVVVLGDRVARDVPGVEAHARTRRLIKARDGAGRRNELTVGGIFGVDAHFDRVTVVGDVVLGEVERLAGGDAQLPLDEVEPGHELGDGVLDLETRVHLEEEELAVLVEELDGAGVHVAARLVRP